eukprot:5892606-Lingulodinium_polyedra.AAC.1
MKSVMGDKRLGASSANSDHWDCLLLSAIVIFTTEIVMLVMPIVRIIASLPCLWHHCGAVQLLCSLHQEWQDLAGLRGLAGEAR